MEVEGEGKFAVNVKCLLDLLKELPDQPLTFEINEQNFEINIFYQNGKFNFVGINGNEFPEKSAMEDSANKFVIPAQEIIAGIEHTLFAVGVEDLRPQMMGIFWDIAPEKIVFVASDTHKLVRYTNDRIKTGSESSFILPTKPATILNSILAKQEGDVTVTTDSKSAIFETPNFTLSCRFVNGKYPNYNSVIPQNNPFKLVVDRISLLNAIRRVSVFASVGGLIKFEIQANEIFLKAEDVDFSTSAEEKVACDYQGEDMTIGFNNTRMIEVLNNLDVDTIIINLSDPSRAGVFLPDTQADGEELLILLMPMMI